MNANNKTMLAEMTKRTDAHQAEIKSRQAEMRAIIKAWSSDWKNDRKETMACLEKTEARLEVEDKPA
jgi:hypothetical protein